MARLSEPAARSEDDIFAALRALCASTGYIHALGYFCFRDNTIRFGDKLVAKDLFEQYGPERLVRTEISTLIGLMAKEPINYDLPTPEIFQQYVTETEELLQELHASMVKPWFESFDFSGGMPKDFNPFSGGASLREPIFYGGESAYGFQYRELAARKYASDDTWLATNYGFTIADATHLAEIIGTYQTETQMAWLKTLRTLPRDQWTMLPAFEFSAEDMAEKSDLPIEIVSNILEAFSLGETETNEKFSALNEFNETNSRPIIRRGNGVFLLLQHYSLLEAIYESPFFWMLSDKTYSPTALSHRGEYTEEVVSEKFSLSFGATRVLKNVNLYRGKNRIGEIDVLVLFGDHAIVVQAKAKRLTLEARKGNDLALKDDFKKAVQDAYDQAYICAEGLLDASVTLELTDGTRLNISDRPRVIFPLCVVADHYPALAFQARQFLKARVSENIQQPLVTDLFAIDVMTEMLDSPLHLLHYLTLRAKAGDGFIASHELTLLSFHIKQNLWIDGEVTLVALADDITADLDVAMLVRREGVPGARTPDGILTRLTKTTVGQLVAQIEARGDPRTTSLGLLLLQMSEDSVRDFSKGIDRVRSDALRDGQCHDASIGFENPPSGLTIHCNSQDEGGARERLAGHCNLRKYRSKADTWYGLLLDPKSGLVRASLTMEGKWEHDPEMEKLVAALPKEVPAKSFAEAIRMGKTKVGRNDPCPCGSGQKYKKCCRP